MIFIMENIFPFIILGWVVICLVSWYWQNVLYKKIMTNHYDKWIELGEPDVFSVFTNFGISPLKRLKMMGKTLKFIFKGDLELDNNKDINNARRVNVYIFYIAIIYVIVTFGAVLIFG